MRFVGLVLLFTVGAVREYVLCVVDARHTKTQAHVDTEGVGFQLYTTCAQLVKTYTSVGRFMKD